MNSIRHASTLGGLPENQFGILVNGVGWLAIPLQQAIRSVLVLASLQAPSNVELAVDVDPISML